MVPTPGIDKSACCAAAIKLMLSYTGTEYIQKAIAVSSFLSRQV